MRHDHPPHRLIRFVVIGLLALASCDTTSATRDEQEAALRRADELQGVNGRLITICMDGTWNVPASDTNVWQFHQLAKAGGRTGNVIAYYTEGVGTTLATKKKGGKLGYGVDSRIADAYSFLGNTWKPGDRIVIVGFSRGAYPARMLAGVINMFGIYSEVGDEGRRTHVDVPDATGCCQSFFDRATSSDSHRVPRHQVPEEHRVAMRGTWHKAEVDCLVCFDTVAAIAPLDQLISATLQDYDQPPTELMQLFPTTKLALHAMALDETRRAFRIVPFLGPHGLDRLRQVWFAGAHSDIGGGYEHYGANQTALGWVLENLPEEVRTLLGTQGAPLPKLHTEDGLMWVVGLRDEVRGSDFHPSVRVRIEQDPSYKPRPAWWGTTGEAKLEH